MISLVLSFGVLIAGYLNYGKIVENVFAPDGRKTPAYTHEDGVDFMQMPTWKAFLVHLLNTAGTGPIFAERHDGASIAELSGICLGTGAKWIMRVFPILLLVLTRTVFVNSPAALLARLTHDTLNVTFWIVAIQTLNRTVTRLIECSGRFFMILIILKSLRIRSSIIRSRN